MELTHPLNHLEAAFDATLIHNDRMFAAGMVDVDLSLVFMFGLFLVFAILLHFIVLKPLIVAQEARRQGMGGAREDASTFELKTAEARLAYDRRLTKARQDAVVIRDALKQDATQAANSSTAAVQAEIEGQLAQGHRDLAALGETARADMKTHVADLSNELTSKLVGGHA